MAGSRALRFARRLRACHTSTLDPRPCGNSTRQMTTVISQCRSTRCKRAGPAQCRGASDLSCARRCPACGHTAQTQ
eukprot:3198405-Rhodomonas_salina.2